MHVVATAGHVDHGKSTLVRALTGMEPDRWAEERRRGMTIDLGYAVTTLPGGLVTAFVDVPGHERFTTNMLAGVGPVPAVLMVVAADDGWGAQTSEHLAALAALGVTHAVLAVTRSDLADPAPALADGVERLAAAGIDADPVAVSGQTGAGLDDVRAALVGMLTRLPAPAPDPRARLWVDRVFSIRGSGTVLTGTLGQGRLATGAEMSISGRPVLVRGLQIFGTEVTSATALARVAVNLRGVDTSAVHRGDALLAPGDWSASTEFDVALRYRDEDRLPRELTLHVGSAALPAQLRPLGGAIARLRVSSPLFLQVGDRGVLRDPGRHRVLAGAVVLDPLPPVLRRRGAAALRAEQLTGEQQAAAAGELTTGHRLATEVTRRGAVRRDTLRRIGVPGAASDAAAAGVLEAGGWLIAARLLQRWGDELVAAVTAGRDRDLLRDGLARPAAAQLLGLPDPALLDAVVASRAELVQHAGRVRAAHAQPALDKTVAAALAPLLTRLAESPFAAPQAGELRAAGLGTRELGAAVAAGLVLRLPGDVVLAPDAVTQATARLAVLPQPFTVSAARQALQTSRRVALPLLEHLDRVGVTDRLADTTRRLRPDHAVSS